VGAAGGSWARAAIVKPAIIHAPNKKAATVRRIFEALRANGIYSSPFMMALQSKDYVLDESSDYSKRESIQALVRKGTRRGS
jgi:hypothetical protein